MLVVAAAAASFAIQLAGFLAILVVLAIAERASRFPVFVPAILLYVPLFALALGFALICAAVQVFVRDLAQALAQILMLLQFAAPIFYDTAQMPERMQRWLALNPFTFYANAFRAVLLHHGELHVESVVIALVVAAVTLLIGHALFRRLDPHFEDFL